MMRSLCFLGALMAAAVASPVSRSEGLEKRIMTRLLGGGEEGGLLGGILGGFLDGLPGDEVDGGCLGVPLKEGEHITILGVLLDELLEGVVHVPAGLVLIQLETAADLVQRLTTGLSGKTEQPEIYAEFEKYPAKKVCPFCGDLPNAQHSSACQQFCVERSGKGQS
ncbi:hypothetical protein BsWGS_27703 [Bradybaena similaris]